MTKDRIKHRIDRINKNLERYAEMRGNKPEWEYYSFHGSKWISYLEGQLSVLEDLLDEMD